MPGLRSKNVVVTLLTAVKKGDVARVGALLDEGADLDLAPGGYPLLAWAAERGRVTTIDLLVQRGAALERAHPGGETALCVAVRYAQLETARHLVALGADPRRYVTGAWCLLAGVSVGEALHYQPEYHHRGGVTLLMLASMADPAIRIHRRDTGTVAFVLELGQDVNARDEAGNTALMLACLWGRCEVAALLLDHGADVAARNEAGQTALAHAVFAPDPSTVELLLSRGANPRGSDHAGTTALALAVLAGNEPAAALLRQATESSRGSRRT